VLRINARYLVELVEAYDVCPFARGARETGALARRVIGDDDALGETLRAIDALAPDEKTVVAILIYPRFGRGFDAFEIFAAEVRARDVERRGGGRGPFALAPFHPNPRFGEGTPAQLVMFFRRAPDPCLQLVRFGALDAVRSPAPTGKFLFDWSAEAQRELERRAQTVPVSDRIAGDNFTMFAREGRARLEAVFADIMEDRARSYARFDKGGR
jgi:hypothetical protein